MTGLIDLFLSSDTEVTLFAPTNAAFEDIDLSSVDLDMLVGNHLVLGTVGEEKLVNNRMFVTLAGTHLHSTTVMYNDYSPSYSGYSYSQSRVVSKILA